MFGLLAVAEIVLALGLLTGMAINYQTSGFILSFDHKTVLTIISFGLIGAILLLHLFSGLRGRIAARWALSAYFCLTLGYPGVKLITHILVST